jgi:hypothetical protein
MSHLVDSRIWSWSGPCRHGSLLDCTCCCWPLSHRRSVGCSIRTRLNLDMTFPVTRCSCWMPCSLRSPPWRCQCACHWHCQHGWCAWDYTHFACVGVCTRYVTSRRGVSDLHSSRAGAVTPGNSSFNKDPPHDLAGGCIQASSRATSPKAPQHHQAAVRWRIHKQRYSIDQMETPQLPLVCQQPDR